MNTPYRAATMGDLQMLFNDGIVDLKVRGQLQTDPNEYANGKGFELNAEQVEKILKVDIGAFEMAEKVFKEHYAHDASIAVRLGVVMCGATRIVRWQSLPSEVAMPCT